MRSPDSEIFFIMLYCANMYPNIIMLFDTGKGNNKKLLNITEMAMSFSQVHCSALPGLHAFRGCDSKSAMKGHDKVRPLGILEKSTEYEEFFSQLGDTWSVSEDIINKLEAFLCTVYGKLRVKDANSVPFHED